MKFSHCERRAGVGALTLHGFIALGALEGTITRDALETYAQKVLFPARHPFDIIIMDNLASKMGRACLR